MLESAGQGSLNGSPHASDFRCLRLASCAAAGPLKLSEQGISPQPVKSHAIRGPARAAFRTGPTGLAWLRRLGGFPGHVQARFPGIRFGERRTVGPELQDRSSGMARGWEKQGWDCHFAFAFTS